MCFGGRGGASGGGLVCLLIGAIAVHFAVGRRVRLGDVHLELAALVMFALAFVVLAATTGARGGGILWTEPLLRGTAAGGPAAP